MAVTEEVVNALMQGSSQKVMTLMVRTALESLREKGWTSSSEIVETVTTLTGCNADYIQKLWSAMEQELLDAYCLRVVVSGVARNSDSNLLTFDWDNWK